MSPSEARGANGSNVRERKRSQASGDSTPSLDQAAPNRLSKPSHRPRTPLDGASDRNRAHNMVGRRTNSMAARYGQDSRRSGDLSDLSEPLRLEAFSALTGRQRGGSQLHRKKL